MKRIIDTYLGAAPTMEPSANVGTPDYARRSRIECRAYLHQLIRMYDDPPEGTSLRIKVYPHTQGEIREVVVVCEEDNEEGMLYAEMLAENLPEKWDEKALRELDQELPDIYIP